MITLKSIREGLKLSQQDVAEAIGRRHKSDVSAVELGDVPISYDMAVKLGRVYRVPPERLRELSEYAQSARGLTKALKSASGLRELESMTEDEQLAVAAHLVTLNDPANPDELRHDAVGALKALKQEFDAAITSAIKTLETPRHPERNALGQRRPGRTRTEP